MPNTHSTLTELFGDIADSIRSKAGTTEPIVADAFPEAIDDIATAKDEETFTATPSLSQQIITPTTGKVFSQGTVNAITAQLLASLDSDFAAENIKKDVDLFGLIGSLEGGGTIFGKRYVDLTVTPSSTSGSIELNYDLLVELFGGAIPSKLIAIVWADGFCKAPKSNWDKNIILNSIGYWDHDKNENIGYAEGVYYGIRADGSFSDGNIFKQIRTPLYLNEENSKFYLYAYGNDMKFGENHTYYFLLIEV